MKQNPKNHPQPKGDSLINSKSTYMSQEQFELKRAEIEALSNDETIIPNMPVAVAVQEAEDLVVWCQLDKEALTKAGLDWQLAIDLPLRIGACRYAQSLWQKEYKSIEDAQKEWQLKSPEAYELRDEILHYFFHAYRKMPDLLSKVQKIAQGSSHADMVQDLSDLAVLGKAHPEPLKAISFDLTLLTKADQTSEAMANLLAQANGTRFNDNKLKIIRDKAFTYMKQAVDEIRRHGQFIFWKQPERYKGYTSRFVKQRTLKAKIEDQVNSK